MAHGHKDFVTEVTTELVEAASFRSGLDADKPASPAAGDIWLARDTFYLYVCNVAGSWEKVTKLYLLLAGGTMSGAIAMGANKITGVADPTLAQDAATKAYADTKLGNIVEDTTPELGGNLDALTKLINNLGAPVAAADAARKNEVDAVDAKLDDVTQSQPSRALSTIYQNTSGKIKIVAVSAYGTAGAGNSIYIYARVAAATPPTTDVNAAFIACDAIGAIANLVFVVPVNYYYRVVSAGTGTATLNTWAEWDLL